MNNIKKVTIILIFILLFLIIGRIKSEAKSSDLYLENLEFNSIIEKNGDMVVNETWDIDIENTNTLYKTFKIDDTKYNAITDVTVTDITDGQEKEFKQIDELMYHVTKNCYYAMENDDGDFEIAWGVGLDDESQHKTYRITYRVKGAVAKYSDYAELYWQFVGKDFSVDAKNIKGTIYLPEMVENKEDIKVWGHTEDLNGEIYVTGNNKIEFTLNNFNSGRYVEIRTLFPTNLITSSTRGEQKEILNDVINEETVWANEANERRTRKENQDKIITSLIIIISLLLAIWFIAKIIKRTKSLKGLKEIKPEEKIIYFREIPREDASPMEALYVCREFKNQIDSTLLGNAFSSSLLDLSLKKKIEFKIEKDNNKDNITIEILNRNTFLEDIPEDEKIFAKILLDATNDNNSITVKELQKYIKRMKTEDITKLPENLYKVIIDKFEKIGIINKKELDKYNKQTGAFAIYFIGLVFCVMLLIFSINVNLYMLIGAIPLVITILINLVLISIQMKRTNVYTQKGINEKEKWKGLKKYMEEFSLLKEKEVPEIILWEKFLVYATVFGISDKVLKQLKIVYPDLDNMIQDGTYPYMYLMINTDFSHSFVSVVSSSMSSAYSSATGGGGGFSGGGGRWTVAGGGGRRKIASYILIKKG